MSEQDQERNPLIEPTIRRRRGLVAAGIATALVLGGLIGGWAARVLLAAPVDVLAAPGFALATAQQGVVGQTLRLNAVAGWEAVASYQVPGGGVITERIFTDGEQAQPGDVLYSVGLRPVVIAQGTIPAFRDLTQGDTGVDVMQLQSMLAATGFFTGEITGSFGASTLAAVLAWQRSLGIADTPAGGAGAAGGATATEIARADQAVRTAETNLFLAERSFLYFLQQHHPERGAVHECSLATNFEDGPAVTNPVNECVRLEQAARDAVDELRFAQDDRARLTAPVVSGVVQRGDIIFVPTLPARVALDAGLTVGMDITATVDAVHLLAGVPTFSITLSDGQLAMISVGTGVDVSSPAGGVWPAVVAELLPSTNMEPARAILTAPDGSPVCGSECDLIPVEQSTLLPAAVFVVPEVTGVVVPAAAVVTTADGTTAVRLADGTVQPVTVVASAVGSAAVSGLEVGTQVRTPGDG